MDIIGKLVELADGLDGLGLKKDADRIDQLIARAAEGEDFDDLMKLFDEPLALEVKEDRGPSAEKVILEEPEVHTPLEEEEAPLAAEKTGPSRLDMIKRRHELLKLKQKMMDAEEAEQKMEEEMAEEPVDVVELPVAAPDESFEDEEDEDMVANEADDDGLIDKLKDVLKSAPELAKQLLQLVKDNPELLELLAL